MAPSLINGDGAISFVGEATRMRIRAAVILGIASAIFFTAGTSPAGKVKIVTLEHPAPHAISWFGRTTTLLNDVDGDGIGEIAIGTPQLFSEDESVRAGAVVVFSGNDNTLLFTLPHHRHPMCNCGSGHRCY